MQALVVHGANDARVEEVPHPTPAPNQVLVAMEWGGICGSDIAYWKHGASGTAILREPLILGHEVAGTVAAVGSEVKGVQEGDRVAIHPATLVGNYQVNPQLQWRTNLWPEVRYFGSAAFMPHEAGAFSQYRVVRPDQLRPLPEGVSTRCGALAEPFGVALHAVNIAGDVRGRDVLVNGCGPIGALTVAACKARGANHVAAADLSATSLEIAASMGADELINIASGEELPADIEIAIEASGAAPALGSVISAVRRGGVLVQVGNLPAGEVSVALGNIVTREIQYRGSYRFVDEISEAIELMASGVDVTPLMTHSFPLAQALEALKVAADRSTGSSKVMLELS